MGGLFGDPWNPSKVVEPDLLKTGADQTPANDQDPSPDEAIIAYINAVAATMQPHDTDLDAIASLATTSFGRALLTLANTAALQSAAGLVVGTDVQAHDSDLDAIAALSTTSFGRGLLALADAAALRVAAGLVIGTDVQAYDLDLANIAALTTTAFGRGLLTLADAAALRSTAGLVIGTNVQAWDADLDAIAALVTTSFGRGLLALADATALRTAAALGTAATQNTGTSGAVIPLLNGANIWSAAQTLASGNKLIFADASGATYQGEFEHVAASPIRILRARSLGGAGGWKGAFYITLSYNAGAEFDALKIEANTDGITAAISVAGSIAATLGITSSGGGIGYATGAGGTITQITSRTTTVILNKLCGEITLFSKTTTAGLVETFTVTNSQMAATDNVVVNVKSGTGIYFCFITGKAAGSFKISVYTPAAVAVAEAPVISFHIDKGVNA